MVCVHTAVAARAHRRFTAVEAGDGGQARDMRMFSWRGSMQVSTMVRARDRVCSGPTSSSGSPGCRACPPVTAASPPRQAHVAVRLAAGGRSVACKCAGGGLAASMCPVARVCRGLPGRCLAPIQPEAWAGSRCGSQASAGRTGEGSGERLRQ